MGNSDKVPAYTRTSTAPIVAAVLAFVAALLFATPAGAQDTQASQIHFGKMIYQLFCVGCHGESGRGNGAVARALQMPPIDLRLISQRNDGVFPADDVTDAITGLGDVRGHRDLPVGPWTEMFAEEFELIAERAIANEMVARRVAHLVTYLESIQE